MAYIQTNGIRSWKKKKKLGKGFVMLIITILALIVSAISAGSTFYFADENRKLQNSLYNYEPFIYVDYSNISTLATISYDPDSSDGAAVFFGYVPVNLKVITPHEGMLTIKVQSFNFTYLNATNNPTSNYLNMDNLNVHVKDFSTKELHQYFVIRDVPNSIDDQIYVAVDCYIKPHLIGQASMVSFILGDVIFEAELLEVRTNQTITQFFNKQVWVELVSKP